MFNGQITFVGSTPSDDIVRESVRIAERLRGEKEAAGMTQALKGYDLPDGTQVYVVDLSDVWTIQIIPPLEPLEHGVYTPSYGVLPIAEPLPIISFVSGAVTTGSGEDIEVEIITDDGDRDVVSVFAVADPGDTVKRVIGGSPPKTAELFTPEEIAVKLGVPQLVAFQSPFNYVPRTQFQSHDPGLFTGAMASIVQLLLGVGRILERDYEQRLIDAMPNRVQHLIRESLVLGEVETDILDVQSLTREDAEHTLYTTQLQLMYDYRWNRTHGIAWGDRTALEYAPSLDLMADPHRTQEPFLVELSNRGILAMPLPRDMASFYPEVRQQYLRVYPELDQYRPFDGASLFDALGGFPTGAGFPWLPGELERYKRAGVVFEANRDLSEFYAGTAFSTGHGWAFADNGRKAINVCRQWRGGLQYGECYEVQFEIQQRHGIEFQVQAEMVIQQLRLTDPVDIHKAHRLTDDQVHHIFTPNLRGNHKSEREAFDELEVQADWVLGVAVTKIREGSVTYGAPMCTLANDNCFAHNEVQFKVYEPVLDFQALTVDFSVGNKHVDLSKLIPVADGPIFATYVNNAPEILHFYNDGDVGSQPAPGSNRQPCQFVGQWVVDNRIRRAGVTGHFYSSTRDFRESFAVESGSVSRVTGNLAGYGDFACTCDPFSVYISLHRTRYFATHSESESVVARERRVSIICATNNRSAYFVCDQVLLRGRRLSESYSGRQTVGRTGVLLEGGIYHFVWHWANWCGRPWGDVPPDGDFRVYKRTPGGTGCGGVLWPEEAPEDITGQYSIWNIRPNGTKTTSLYQGYTVIINSPFKDGDTLNFGCMAYKDPPNLPSSWSRTISEGDEIEYKVYGFGLPEMNGRVLREVKHVQGDDESGFSFRSSGANASWWQCAIPWFCYVPAWYVVRNNYGVPFVQTKPEIVSEDTVEYGRRPELAGGLGQKLFGIVE